MSLIYNAIDLALETGEGLLVGRNGSTELMTMIEGPVNANKFFLECAGVWDNNGKGVENANAPTMANGDSSVPLRGAKVNEHAILKWIISSKAASAEADLLATGWYQGLAVAEQRMLTTIGFLGQKIHLRDIEPYYTDEIRQWTRLLRGQRVCAVSPFYLSLSAGYRARGEIWNNGLLPEFKSFSVVRSYFAPLIGGATHSWGCSWEEAVNRMEAEVLKTGARVVLIGCGGLGMILGSRLKKRGLICIVMGGALQILFGVKGKRWNEHKTISRFYNINWIVPQAEEIPPGAGLIEGGCYW